MKSIIQEASSISKAVEEGWIKAQKPQQFSVKILEEAEKNFLGLTRKSAKVAIFFEEQNTVQSAHKIAQDRIAENKNKQSQQRFTPQQQQPRQQEVRAKPAQQQQQQRQAPVVQHAAPQAQASTQPAQPKKQFEPLWNQGMVERTQQWMDDALRNSNNGHIQFTVEPQKFHLRITLSTPILSDPDKEKQLLASFSALILETLKRTFKMSLRGHKIVLTHKPK